MPSSRSRDSTVSWALPMTMTRSGSYELTASMSTFEVAPTVGTARIAASFSGTVFTLSVICTEQTAVPPTSYQMFMAVPARMHTRCGAASKSTLRPLTSVMLSGNSVPVMGIGSAPVEVGGGSLGDGAP